MMRKNDSPGVRRGTECPGGKLRQWDPEEVFWSLALGMSWFFIFCMYFMFILFIAITTFHMLSFFPPNRVYLKVPIFVTSHY